MRIILAYNNYGTGGEDSATGQLFYWRHELVEDKNFELVWKKIKVFYQEGDKRLD